MAAPAKGDVVAARVLDDRQHTEIVTLSHNPRRVKKGDLILGILTTAPNRRLDESPAKLFLEFASPDGQLSPAPAMGFVRGTRLTMEGYVCDSKGERINYQMCRYPYRPKIAQLPPVLLHIHLGHHTEKTIVRPFADALGRRGMEISIGKLIPQEYDSGVGDNLHTMVRSFHGMISDMTKSRPDFIVIDVPGSEGSPLTDALITESFGYGRRSMILLNGASPGPLTDAAVRVESGGHRVVALCVSSEQIGTGHGHSSADNHCNIDKRLATNPDSLADIVINSMNLEWLSLSTRSNIQPVQSRIAS